MLLSGKCQQDADTGDLIAAVETDDLATARAIVQVSNAVGVAAPSGRSKSR
jgi:hypothetical protein